MQRAEYKRINVRGSKLRYVEAGEGPVVLLLHGILDSLLNWYCNIDALADAGYRVIAPDLPGFGDSDKPYHVEYDSNPAAEFVFDFRQSLGIERFALVGSAAGGLISGLIALEHPEIVEKMVLVDLGRVRSESDLVAPGHFCSCVGQHGVQDLGQREYGDHQAPVPPPTRLLGRTVPRDEPPGSASWGAHRHAAFHSLQHHPGGVLKDRYILERLKDSEVPLMTVWGSEDKIIPVRHAEDVRRNLPNSIVQIIPECGHWPQMGKPLVFNALLTHFLEEEKPQPSLQAS